MKIDPSTLARLAENRRRRMDDRGRPAFALTADEAHRSTGAAMRVADAAPAQVDERHVRPTGATA
jgi:hypothetical protein